MSFYRKTGFRRIIAFGVDWLVIALWGALLFGAVLLLSGGDPAAAPGPWTAQALGFVAMTLPVTLYFGVLESSELEASLGKRALGLRVCAARGGRLGFGASVLRNALKFVPWELGHLVAQQAIYAGDGSLAAWIYLPMALSMGLPAWWIASLIRGGETPYDRWAGGKVVSVGG